MDASEVSHLFLRKASLLPQGADVGTESGGVVIHDSLATGAGCHDASGDLDYKPIDYE